MSDDVIHTSRVQPPISLRADPNSKASSIHVGYVVCKLTLGRVFLPSLYFRGADGRIIWQWILKKWGGEIWTGLSWLRVGTGECGELLD
jgi:hypothetical protein